MQCTAIYVGAEDTLSQYEDRLLGEEQFRRFHGRMVSLVINSPVFRTYNLQRRDVEGANRVEAFFAELVAQAGAASAE